jgi:hypothetical protein
MINYFYNVGYTDTDPRLLSICPCGYDWEHVFDFLTSDGGFVALSCEQWVNGSGWGYCDDDNPGSENDYRTIGISRTFDLRDLLYVKVYHSINYGTIVPATGDTDYIKLDGDYVYSVLSQTKPESPLAWTGDNNAASLETVIQISIMEGSFEGSGYIHKIVVRGLGDNPFI